MNFDWRRICEGEGGEIIGWLTQTRVLELSCCFVKLGLKICVSLFYSLLNLVKSKPNRKCENLT